MTILRKHIGIRVESALFRRKHLADIKTLPNELAFRHSPVELKLDHRDLKIIEGLRQIPYSSRRDLARKLSMSHSTLEYRLERLVENNVLFGFAYGVAADKIGMQFFRILVSIRDFGEDLRDLCYEFASQHPSIVSFIHCMGTWDFELVVETNSTADVAQIRDELYQALGDRIGTVLTIPIFQFLNLRNVPLTFS